MFFAFAKTILDLNVPRSMQGTAGLLTRVHLKSSPDPGEPPLTEFTHGPWKIHQGNSRCRFSGFVLPPEGGPPARNPLKIQKIRPLEKQVPFLRFFCPRREDPRLVVHLKFGFGGRDKGLLWGHFFDMFRIFSDFFQGCSPVFLGCSGTMK